MSHGFAVLRHTSPQAYCARALKCLLSLAIFAPWCRPPIPPSQPLRSLHSPLSRSTPTAPSCSYSLGDKVERWLNDLLCLDAAEHTPPPPARLPHPGGRCLGWPALRRAREVHGRGLPEGAWPAAVAVCPLTLPGARPAERAGPAVCAVPAVQTSASCTTWSGTRSFRTTRRAPSAFLVLNCFWPALGCRVARPARPAAMHGCPLCVVFASAAPCCLHARRCMPLPPALRAHGKHIQRAPH